MQGIPNDDHFLILLFSPPSAPRPAQPNAARSLELRVTSSGPGMHSLPYQSTRGFYCALQKGGEGVGILHQIL